KLLKLLNFFRKDFLRINLVYDAANPFWRPKSFASNLLSTFFGPTNLMDPTHVEASCRRPSCTRARSLGSNRPKPFAQINGVGDRRPTFERIQECEKFWCGIEPFPMRMRVKKTIVNISFKNAVPGDSHNQFKWERRPRCNLHQAILRHIGTADFNWPRQADWAHKIDIARPNHCAASC